VFKFACANSRCVTAGTVTGGKRGRNEYGKPKFPLFNIVTSGLQQSIESM